MKRQFALIRGKLDLHWEIDRDGAAVTTRTWGRNRKEYILTKRHPSEDDAKRDVQQQIESQLRRGFVGVGAGAKKTKPRLIPEGPDAVAVAKRAIVSKTVAQLRELGFQGTFPNFRRIAPDRHAVVSFIWGRAQGSVSAHLGVVPPRAGTTPSVDVKRALNVRNRERISIKHLIDESADFSLLSFDSAADKWGAKWPERLAEMLTKLLETKGMAWLEAAERRPGRG